MVLRQIDLTNFRLHRKTTINFSDGINYIIGGNGQGKTTILEAIYYLCTTKNINAAADSDVVSFGQEMFEASGDFNELSKDHTKIVFDLSRNKKFYYLNEKAVNSSASVIGRFPIVVLIQSDHAITLGGPSDRRKFVDTVISQASQTYLRLLIDYNKTLKQRTNLLLQIRETGNNRLLEQLNAWSESLVNAGTEIIKHRKNFVNEFNIYIKEAYNRIMTDKEEPEILYESSVNTETQTIEENFKSALLNERDNEIRRAVNLVGPHRDEFIFKINGLELRRFGSQGQHKTFQVSLRFGEFFYLKEKLGKTPIFLMDDIFGELDIYRASKISEYLPKVGQTFITMTDLTKLDDLNKKENRLVIIIEQGKASYA